MLDLVLGCGFSGIPFGEKQQLKRPRGHQQESIMSNITEVNTTQLKHLVGALGLTQAEEYEMSNEKFLYAFEQLGGEFYSIDSTGAKEWVELVERKLERLLKERDERKQEVIEFAPTWEYAATIHMMVLRNPDADARAVSNAEAEIKRMAKMADAYSKLVKEGK